jgi:hypothetical protein
MVMEFLSTGKRMREDEVARRLTYAGVRLDGGVRQAVETLLDESFPAHGSQSATSHLTYEPRIEYDAAIRREVRVGYFGLSKSSEAFRPFQGLRNLPLITELPDGQRVIVGSRLYDLVYQTWLPNQFVTFEGKYYQIVSITLAGGVVMRRASDHFSGRVYYRQLRSYSVVPVADLVASDETHAMGSIRVTCERADINVCTHGYLVLDDYADVAHARTQATDCVPDRSYHNKEFLRLKLAGASEAVTRTVAIVMSELFATLFPRDHQYLSVLSTAAQGLPEGILCSMTNVDDAPFECDEILVVEDSPIDIGLRQAVERNMTRILETVFEYLDWHETAQVNAEDEGRGEV